MWKVKCKVIGMMMHCKFKLSQILPQDLKINCTEDATICNDERNPIFLHYPNSENSQKNRQIALTLNVNRLYLCN